MSDEAKPGSAEGSGLDRLDRLDQPKRADLDQAKRRSPVRRAVLISLALGVVALLAVLGWTGWRLWQAGTNLQALQTLAKDAAAAAARHDLNALGGYLPEARRLAASASAAADDPLVAFAAGLPWVGDDVTVVRELSFAAADLTSATKGLDALLPRVAAAGITDLSVADAIFGWLSGFRPVAADAAVRLGKLDTSSLMLPVGDQVVRLRTGLEQVSPAVDALAPFLNTLSILAAPGEERTWLVIMQNLGEARPSGGLVGAWLVVKVNDGQIKVVRSGTNDELVASGTMEYRDIMPEGYQQLWGDSLGEWASMNLSANFPDNARLFVRGWNQRGLEHVDGVFVLGQGTVKHLAAATGPVQVGNRQIKAADLADYLLVGVYRDFPDPVKKDKAVAAIVAQVLSRLSGGKLDLIGFLSSALTQSTGDYLQLWSSDSTVQKRIVAAELSGKFGDTEGPITSVRLINGGGNKLDAFAKLGVHYQLGECVVSADGLSARASTLTVTLANTAPDGLPSYISGRSDVGGIRGPVGSNRDFVAVYAPARATITSTLMNGKEAFVHEAWIRERDMVVFDVQLDPDASATMTVTWQEDATDSDEQPLPLTPRVVLPPLAIPASVQLTDGSACR